MSEHTYEVTVSWTGNRGPGTTGLRDYDRDHTVTADNGSFDSGNLVTGATYRRAFNTVGTYAYHCIYHDGMTGSVTVNRAPVVATVVSFGPTPLRLAGTGRLRAVYRIGQASTLRASVQHLRPLYTVRTFAQRTLQGAGRTSYVWDGKTNRRRDVRPGRYRMNLTVVDRAGSRRVVRTTFRVVR